VEEEAGSQKPEARGIMEVEMIGILLAALAEKGGEKY
jgi:hypothetical protein